MGAAGFEEVAFEAIDEPIEPGADADDAFRFVARSASCTG